MRGGLTRFQGSLVGASVLLLALAFTLSGAVRWWGILLVLVVESGVVGLGVMRPGWRFFGDALCRARVTTCRVALTFDDGPDPAITVSLLDLLARLGVRATFFVVGVKAQAHPQICRRAAEEGHQLENHSFAHSACTNFFSTQRLCRDLAMAQSAVLAAAGRAPRYFRPPMGLTNQRVFRAARAMDLWVVGWTVRGRDQGACDPERIVRRLVKGCRPGAILMLHDGWNRLEVLLRTVELLIDSLRSRGYECVRLDALMDGE